MEGILHEKSLTGIPESDSGIALADTGIAAVITDQMKQGCVENHPCIENKDEEIKKLQATIKDLQEIVKKGKHQQQETVVLQEESFSLAKLMEENNVLKKKLETTSLENEQLAKDCINLAQGVAEREMKIEELEDKLVELKDQPRSTWVKSLLVSTEGLKEELQRTSMEKEELAKQCENLFEVITGYSDEVLVLESRIKEFEDERTHFVDAKEEQYSSLVQVLFEDIETLGEKLGKIRLEKEELKQQVALAEMEVDIELKCLTKKESQEEIRDFESVQMEDCTNGLADVSISKVVEGAINQDSQKTAVKGETDELEDREEVFQESTVEILEQAEDQEVGEERVSFEDTAKVSEEKQNQDSKLMVEMKAMAVQLSELKELVEFLELERKFNLEDIDEFKARNNQLEENKEKLLCKKSMLENDLKKLEGVKAKLKAMKERSTTVGNLANRERMRRKILERRCKKMNEKYERFQSRNVKEKLKERRVVSELERKNKMLEEYGDQWREIAVKNKDCKTRLEIAMIRRLDEFEVMKIQKEKLREGRDEEKKLKNEIERKFMEIETEKEGIKGKLDAEMKKNAEFESKVSKLEGIIEKEKKPSMNCFQRLFRRRIR